MKIAIVKNSNNGFAKRWIDYCNEQRISYKIVNCYDSDIIKQLYDCDAFIWHHHHGDCRDVLFAKQLLYSIESSGIKVFPNFNTCWHFDDKVGQKYLLEANDIPTVPSYVFYSKREAFNWLNTTKYPIVFKLRRGAGSSNVRLIRDKSDAKKIVRKAFSKGFSQFDRIENFKESIRIYKERKSALLHIFKGFARLFIGTYFSKMSSPEKGYVYFQEFIPNNTFDIRIIVIGNKAFGIKRLNRKNDFRASGSGSIIYSKNEIPEICVKIAFDSNRKLNSQCIAFDFIFNNGIPLIVEISYGFSAIGYDPCEGYWDESLIWHQGKFNPYGWMVDNLIRDIMHMSSCK